MQNTENEVSENDILIPDEVCKLLKVSQPTLWWRLSDKREPGKIYGKKVGGVWRIQRKDIYRYLNGLEDKNKKKELIESDILSFKEVCKILRITQPTLDKILSDKREPGKIYGRKFGKSWKIQRKDIYRYLDEENIVEGKKRL